MGFLLALLGVVLVLGLAAMALAAAAVAVGFAILIFIVLAAGVVGYFAVYAVTGDPGIGMIGAGIASILAIWGMVYLERNKDASGGGVKSKSSVRELHEKEVRPKNHEPHEKEDQGLGQPLADRCDVEGLSNVLADSIVSKLQQASLEFDDTFIEALKIAGDKAILAVCKPRINCEGRGQLRHIVKHALGVDPAIENVLLEILHDGIGFEKILVCDGTGLHTAFERLGNEGTVFVGGKNESEINKTKAEMEKCLKTLADFKEYGALPAAGNSFLKCQSSLNTVRGNSAAENKVIRAVITSLDAPISRLAILNGAAPDQVIEKVLSGKGLYGYNYRKNSYGDLWEMGVLEPGNVPMAAIHSAIRLVVGQLTESKMDKKAA